jgi:hypothetical protein
MKRMRKNKLEAERSVFEERSLFFQHQARVMQSHHPLNPDNASKKTPILNNAAAAKKPPINAVAASGAAVQQVGQLKMDPFTRDDVIAAPTKENAIPDVVFSSKQPPAVATVHVPPVPVAHVPPKSRRSKIEERRMGLPYDGWLDGVGVLQESVVTSVVAVDTDGAELLSRFFFRSIFLMWL